MSPTLKENTILLTIFSKSKDVYPANVEYGKKELIAGVLGGLIGMGVTLSICGVDRRKRGDSSSHALPYTPLPNKEIENMSNDNADRMRRDIGLLKGIAIGKQQTSDLMARLIASFNEEMQRISNIQYALIANNLELLGKHQEYMLCISQQALNSNDTYENKLDQLKKTFDCRLIFLEKTKKTIAQIQLKFLQLEDEAVTHYAVLIKKYLISYQARQKTQMELVYHKFGRGLELGKKMVELQLESLAKRQ